MAATSQRCAHCSAEELHEHAQMMSDCGAGSHHIECNAAQSDVRMSQQASAPADMLLVGALWVCTLHALKYLYMYTYATLFAAYHTDSLYR